MSRVSLHLLTKPNSITYVTFDPETKLREMMNFAEKFAKADVKLLVVTTSELDLKLQGRYQEKHPEGSPDVAPPAPAPAQGPVEDMIEIALTRAAVVKTNILPSHAQNVNTQFRCPDCQKLFKNKNTLKRHTERSHMKVRNHICQVCSRGFFAKVDLQRHLKTHV